jgi:hypothetical protein
LYIVYQQAAVNCMITLVGNKELKGVGSRRAYVIREMLKISPAMIECTTIGRSRAADIVCLSIEVGDIFKGRYIVLVFK